MGPTPTKGEEAQQVTTPITETAEYILPHVDPNFSIKQEDMSATVKVEATQVEKGVGGRTVCGLCRKSFNICVFFCEAFHTLTSWIHLM